MWYMADFIELDLRDAFFPADNFATLCESLLASAPHLLTHKLHMVIKSLLLSFQNQ